MSLGQTLQEWKAQEAAVRSRLGSSAPLPREKVSAMSGMEVFEAIFSGDLPAPPIGETMDFIPIHMAHGVAVFQGRPLLRHYNPLGTVHGGWFCTLLDSAMGCAVHTTLPAGKGYTTLEVKVNMLRPLTDAVPLVRAEGKVIHLGRQVATAEGRIVDADGKVYGHATTTCLIFDQAGKRTMTTDSITGARRADARQSSAEHLLTGPILPILLRFSLPNMVAMLAIALAAMAETGYVGHFGAPALAGMALVFPFVMLQTMLSAGAMGGGVSSAVSRALGAGDAERANVLAVHALWIGVAAGTLFMLLMEVFGPSLMHALGGRGEALMHAVAYGEVAFAGSVFLWVVNTLSSVIRGSGNMRVPSVTLLLVALAQVLLAGALGLGWFSLSPLGMRGVAAGGVLANAAGALFLWAYLAYGQGKIRLTLRGTPLVRQHLLDILKVGAVACISPLQTVLTILILTRLVTTFGTQTLAGYGIGTRLEFLLVPIAFAVGVASVPLVGMAIGAGDSARARKAAWTAAALATAILGALGLLVAVAPQLWTLLYTQDPLVMASSASYFLWAGPFYGFFGLGLSLYFSSLGAGKAVGPVLAGTLRLLVVAAGGTLLAYLDSPAWMIFALVGVGMAVYGVSSVLFIKNTPWGERESRS